MKCIVAECPNDDSEGVFIGSACSPCYWALQGYLSPIAAHRIIASVLRGMPGAESVRAPVEDQAQPERPPENPPQARVGLRMPSLVIRQGDELIRLRGQKTVLADRLEQIALYEECEDDDYIGIYGDPGGITQGEIARATLDDLEAVEAAE